MWEPDLCVFHGNCDDGFGAAWAIWKRWPDVEFVPGVYGKPLPDVKGRNVLFVDFSAPYDVMVKASFEALSLVVIDHHKTAQEALSRLPPFKGTMESLEQCFAINWTQNTPAVAAWFDMEQSGAAMAWKFAHEPQTLPEMIRLIEDRDLWRFKYGERTKRFSAALRTYPMDFETWDWIAGNVGQLEKEGEVVLRAHRANIEKFMKDAYEDEVAGHIVPIVNVPYHYASDTAHALLEKYPKAPFTACWFRRGDGMIQWSLRSEDHRLDVSEIAKQLGGGGHRNAAGFQHPAGDRACPFPVTRSQTGGCGLK